MHLIKNANYLMTGIFLILVSLLAYYLSWPLSTFTDVGVGSGFVPRMFATVQAFLGLLLIVSSFITKAEEEADGGWQLRPLIVLVAIAFFGITIEQMGMVVAIVGLVLIACTANSGTRFFEAIILAVGSAVFSVLVFVKALGLLIPVWPAGLIGG